MKLIYLAGPYTHTDPLVRERRYHLLLKAEALLIREGHAVISPINMCHELGKIYRFHYGYEFWQRRDRLLLSKCDEVIVLTEPGYKESVGVTDEIHWAETLEIPVKYMMPQELDKLERMKDE